MAKSGSLVMGVLFVGVLAGSFLTWGHAGADIDLVIVEVKARGGDVNAWNSELDVGSVEIDNWIVVAEAAAATILAVLRSGGALAVPRFVGALLCAAAVAQSALKAIDLGDGGKVGTGLVVTIAATALMTLHEGFGKD